MDGGFDSSMAAAARRLVLSCARPAALEALESLSGSCAARARLDGDDASYARRRGPFGRSTPTTGCPSRGARLQRARRQGEPGSWALEPRARLLLGRSSVGWSEGSPWSFGGESYAGCFENFRLRALHGNRESRNPELAPSDVQGSLPRRLRSLPLSLPDQIVPKRSDLVSALPDHAWLSSTRSELVRHRYRHRVTKQRTLCALTAA